MRNGQEQQASMMLMESYLRRSDKTAAEELPKLMKLGEVRYGRVGQQRFFLQLFWMTFKKNLKKENFAASCRRFMGLLDELLEADSKRNSGGSFRPHISEAIVEYYSFIFSHIFEYRAHELIVDLKVYRLLWIHSLTDEAFVALRSEISQKYRNFDLSKGIPAENMDKIRKRCEKKGINEEELNRYLTMGRTDQRKSDPSPSAERKSQPSPSSERRLKYSEGLEETEDIRRKRVKPDTIYQNYPPPSSQGYPQQQHPNYPPPPQQSQNYQSVPQQTQNYPPQAHNYPPAPQQGQSYPPSSHMQYQPSQPRSNPNLMNESYNYSNPYGNNYTPSNSAYPPRQAPPQPPHHLNPPNMNSYISNPLPPQNSYPNYRSSYPPPPPTSIPPPHSYNPPIPQPHSQPQPHPTYYNQGTSTQSKLYAGYPESGYRSVSPAPQPPAPSQPSMQEPTRRKSSGGWGVQKHRMMLANLKAGLTECRQCGILFQCRQNLQKHQKEHFAQAQKRFMQKEAQTVGVQKLKHRGEGFDLLCDVKTWIAGDTRNEQTRYEAAISGLPEPQRGIQRHYCFFCNEELRLAWCEQLQEWALEDSLKVDEESRGVTVAHSQCYHSFHHEQPLRA